MYNVITLLWKNSSVNKSIVFLMNNEVKLARLREELKQGTDQKYSDISAFPAHSIT